MLVLHRSNTRAVAFGAVALVALAHTGCGSDDGGSSSAGSGGAGSGGTAGSSASGGMAGSGGIAGGGDTTAPTISNLAYIENPNNALSGYLELDTDEAATISVTVTDDEQNSFTLGSSAAGTSHRLLVLGLRAEHSYTFDVSATDSAGNRSSDEAQTTTAALPGDFPPIAVNASNPALMERGVTLFNVFRWTPGLDGDWGLLLAVNEAGEVIWYHRNNGAIEDVRRLSNGNLIFGVGNAEIREIDMAGNEVASWTAAELGVDSLHHEVFELPNGNLVTLGTELRNVSGYEGGTTSYDIVGDTIVEFQRDGTLVRSVSTIDLLDPLRTRPGFDAAFWDDLYPQATGGTKDWSHGNAIIHDPGDDSFILSLRHQDWLIKVNRSDDSLAWRLGEDGDFTMDGAGDWQYHQHAPQVTGSGSLMVYDNGNARTGLMGSPYTRVVEYQLDTSTPGSFTVKQLWEYRGDGAYFAPFVGDADLQPGGTVLITDGGMVDDPTANLQDPDNTKFARIVEVTRDAAPAKVFELVIDDRQASAPTGYTVYRSERLPSLYASVQ